MSWADRRIFLIKVNSEAAPRGLGVPKTGSEWENGSFLTNSTLQSREGRKLPAQYRKPPQAGEVALIWINQLPKTGAPGKGLTAVAKIATDPVSDLGNKLRIQVHKVVLYHPIGIINNSHLHGPSGGVLGEISALRTTSLRCLSPEHAQELAGAVQSRGGSLAAIGGLLAAPQEPRAPMPPSPKPGELAVEQQKIVRLVEQRQNQGPFRDAVMTRDGRCAVTRCRTAEVLEAAHLIPYASYHPRRDDPENGLLLRADIHTLLDRHLIAINPETMSLWVSPRLRETSYASLGGKKIRTGAGLAYLRERYQAALRADRGEAPYS